jgi:hypothetical protein
MEVQEMVRARALLVQKGKTLNKTKQNKNAKVKEKLKTVASAKSTHLCLVLVQGATCVYTPWCG